MKARHRCAIGRANVAGQLVHSASATLKLNTVVKMVVIARLRDVAG